MRTTRRGFTLIELMIVVVIMGVLAAIAIPVFSGYVKSAKAEEARVMLHQIRLKQEIYMQAYGRYCAIPEWFPMEPGAIQAQEGNKFPWEGARKSEWDMLGVKPSSKYVYHVYRIGAGGPTGPTEDPDAVNQMGMDTEKYWWYAQANGDLDADGQLSFFELTSQRDTVYENLPNE